MKFFNVALLTLAAISPLLINVRILIYLLSFAGPGRCSWSSINPSFGGSLCLLSSRATAIVTLVLIVVDLLAEPSRTTKSPTSSGASSSISSSDEMPPAKKGSIPNFSGEVRDVAPGRDRTQAVPKSGYPFKVNGCGIGNTVCPNTWSVEDGNINTLQVAFDLAGNDENLFDIKTGNAGCSKSDKFPTTSPSDGQLITNPVLYEFTNDGPITSTPTKFCVAVTLEFYLATGDKVSDTTRTFTFEVKATENGVIEVEFNSVKTDIEVESDSSDSDTIIDTNRATDINLGVTTSLVKPYFYGQEEKSGKHLPVTLTVQATGGASDTYKYRVAGLYEDDKKESNVATKKSNPAVPLDFTDDFGPTAGALTLPGPVGTKKGEADIEFFIPLKYFQYGSGKTPRLIIWLDVEWSVDGSSWPSGKRILRRPVPGLKGGSRQLQEEEADEDEESMTKGTKEVGMAVDMVPMETDAGTTVYQFKIVSVTALSVVAGAAALILW